MKWRTAHTNTILFKKGSLAKITTRCHFLSFDVTGCHSLSLAVPLVVIRWHCCTTHCHSLSFVVTRCTTRCHSLYHSLSLDVPLICLFINNLAFLLCHISTFDACLFNKCVQISHVSVKLVITIEKKLDEIWTRLTFLQLNGWGENCQIF